MAKPPSPTSSVYSKSTKSSPSDDVPMTAMQTIHPMPLPPYPAVDRIPSESDTIAPTPTRSDTPQGRGDSLSTAPLTDAKTTEPLMPGIETARTVSAEHPDGAAPMLDITDTLGKVVTMHNGKKMLTEDVVYEKLAHAWSARKKWILLTVVAICQTSMNFNAAIYSNAVDGINDEFGVKNGRMGMVAFLVAYAFGCELWAPWSEELGRYKIMQISLLCLNISIVICAVSVNFPMMIVGRVLGGLSSAGGSVTLGMVADMFTPEEQQHAVLWASLWSCLGAVVGGITGGPVQQYLDWRWIFYLMLIFSCTTQLIHAFVAKETRATTLLDKEAKRLRREEGADLYGPNEVRTFKERWNPKEFGRIMLRPYQMFLCEPIVLFLSLLSGFADALIFMFFESYGIVFKHWDFTPTQVSLVLIALFGAYWIAALSYLPIIRRHNARRARGEVLAPETRLYWLLWLVPLLPIGLFGSAFVGTKSSAGVIVFTVPIGIANIAIYFATIDYMVECYGEYSASATGGNGFARDFLAGMCALYTAKMFHNLGVQNTYFLLFGLGLALCIPVYVFYCKGPAIRKRSKFAQELKAKKENVLERRGEMKAARGFGRSRASTALKREEVVDV